jgi:hypothetical protein
MIFRRRNNKILDRAQRLANKVKSPVGYSLGMDEISKLTTRQLKRMLKETEGKTGTIKTHLRPKLLRELGKRTNQ